MKIKSLAAASLLCIATSGAFAAFATPIAFQPLNDGSGSESGSFSGLGSGAAFVFDAVAGSSLDLASVTSTYLSTTAAGSVLSGFHVTGLTLDGSSFGANAASSLAIGSKKTPRFNNYDNWSFSVDALSGGTHVLEVFGTGTPSLGAQAFTGTLTLTPAVPEPETYALMLAGIGALGIVGRRRKAS
jgi:hypothetical protein